MRHSIGVAAHAHFTTNPRMKLYIPTISSYHANHPILYQKTNKKHNPHVHPSRKGQRGEKFMEVEIT